MGQLIFHKKIAAFSEENYKLHSEIFLYGNFHIGNGYWIFFIMIRDCIMEGSNS